MSGQERARSRGRASSLGREVVAIDADPAMVAMSAEALPGLALEASLPDLPFDDDTLDATIWPAEVPAWAALVNRAFKAAGVVPIASSRLDPQLDFARSVSGLQWLAESASLKAVIATEL